VPALRNARHEAMAFGLAVGKAIWEAYVAAGFSGKAHSAASSVAKRPDVQKRVQELVAARHEKELKSNERAIDQATIDKSWVVQRAKYIVELGIRGGAPILGKDGKPTGAFSGKPNLNAAVKSLALLASMGGYLVQRHEFGQPGDFSRLTDEELDAKMIEVGEAIGISGPALQKAIAGRGT
jgi:hypothetical protein